MVGSRDHGAHAVEAQVLCGGRKASEGGCHTTCVRDVEACLSLEQVRWLRVIWAPDGLDSKGAGQGKEVGRIGFGLPERGGGKIEGMEKIIGKNL